MEIGGIIKNRIWRDVHESVDNTLWGLTIKSSTVHVIDFVKKSLYESVADTLFIRAAWI